MNKYTLEFINENMEADFRQAKLINVQRPIYTCLLLSALVYSIFGTIQICIQETFDQAKFTLFITSALIVQCFITVRHPSIIWLNQIISLYLSLLTQLDLGTATQPQDYFTYGANIQFWQTFVFTLCEFKHSLHLIFCSTVMKVSILFYYNTSDYRDIFGLISLGVIFLVMNYLNNKITRSQYLLTKKDLRWQQYMPSIIQKPYFIFEYDDTQRCFFSIEQQLLNFIEFQESYNCTLKQFLRKAQIENMTLEQYLFKQYLTTHVEESTLEAIYEKTLITIRLYDLNIKNNQYLMIIDTHMHQQFNQQMIHSANILQYTKFIKLNSKVSRFAFNAAHEIRTKIMNNLFLSSSVLFSQQIKQVNLTRLIFKLSKMYKLGYQINIRVVSHSDIYLSTFHQQLFCFMNYLFLLFRHQYSKQEQRIEIILEIQEPDVVYFKICVLDLDSFSHAYQRSPILKQLEPKLLYSPISKNLELKFVFNIQQSFK